MENSTIAIVGVAGYLALKSGLLGTKKTRRKKTKRAVSVTTKNIRQVLRKVGVTKAKRHKIVKRKNVVHSVPVYYIGALAPTRDTIQYSSPIGPMLPNGQMF